MTEKYDLIAGLLTDVGCHRQINEDSGRFVRPLDPETLGTKGTLVVVADGMGGHSAGEIASRLAVDTVNKVYYRSGEDPAAALKSALMEANRGIYELSLTNPSLKGMGTTCTALACCGELAVHAHVGDSRLYLVRDRSIYLMSEDHSMVARMVAEGKLAREEARTHPERNVILRALGTRREVDVSTWESPFPVRAGDRFVLCSDGLYDLVSEDTILQAALSLHPHDACEQLISLARAAGGFDNITVAVVLVQDRAAPSKSPPSTRETKAVAGISGRATGE